MAYQQFVVFAVVGIGLLLTSHEAQAAKTRIVSGLSGAQDTESRELLKLSPEEADKVARRDLLSVLQSTGQFTTNNSHNVDGITLTTLPYSTVYESVCREDRVTLRYRSTGRYDAAGKWLGTSRQAVGVEAQPVFHIGKLPVLSFDQRTPGTSYPVTICDVHHPGEQVTWFAAPTDTDAVRAANMFRMAEDLVKADQLAPGPCDPQRGKTCREWILSFDDPSKIQSVEPCAASAGDNACYIFSFEGVDITITGTIPNNTSEPIAPTAISSIQADTVMEISI